jgi:hypothetical protein
MWSVFCILIRLESISLAIRIYNGQNLLHIQSKNFGDYGRQILRTIYAHDELVWSILPPDGGQYSRKPLDEVKFNTFFSGK